MFRRVVFVSSLFLLASSGLFAAEKHKSSSSSEEVSAKEADPLYMEMKERSIPSDPANSTLYNPWGERLTVINPIPDDFYRRIVAAAEVYRDQKIKFDGFVGSDEDGLHYLLAADGKDLAVYGDSQNKDFYNVKNGKVDDVGERVWVCPDYPVHVLTLAGFPLRQAIAEDWNEDRNAYTFGGSFSANAPVDHWFFRRVENLRTYLKRRQLYWDERITRDQYFDPNFRPLETFLPGDVIIMGHYRDNDGLGEWWPKHSGIVGSIDERGLPVRIYNMRVASNLFDKYDSVINHSREINGESVFFKRFCDRYSIIGHGRIVNGFEPPSFLAPSNPEVATNANANTLDPSHRFIPGLDPTDPGMQW